MSDLQTGNSVLVKGFSSDHPVMLMGSGSSAVEQPDDIDSNIDIREFAERISRWIASAKTSAVIDHPDSCLWQPFHNLYSPAHNLGQYKVLDVEAPSSTYVFLTNANYAPQSYSAYQALDASVVGTALPFWSTVRAKSGIDAVWDNLRKSLDRWSRLTSDWDGDDGLAPSKESISHARRFLLQIRALNLKVPKAYINGDGEIGFRWRKGDRFASAAFLPDGHFVGFIDGQSNIDPIRIDLPVDLFTDRTKFFEGLSGF